MTQVFFKRTASVILAGGVLLMNSACMTLPQKSDAGDSGSTASVDYLRELQTSPELRIKDFPVPAGYEYNPKKSMIVEYGTTQAGIIQYEGPDDAGALIAFFRREMPKYNWTLVNMIEMDDTTMIFDKAERVAKVTILPGGGLSKRSVVSVYYAPKQ